MHFTYQSEPDGASLCQGDVLKRTDALDDLIRRVHKHFLDPKYVRFMVLTQSCDLVRRLSQGACKAPYITIAVVRRADEAVAAELRAVLRSRSGMDLLDGRFVSDKVKQALQNKVESLLNNNAPDFFFLKADSSAGVPLDLCAFLRVSVALRAEHYDVLLAAKSSQLSGEFQAKLGWLVGHNYSRVGTSDWGKEVSKRAEPFVRDACDWVEDRRFKAVSKKMRALGADPTVEDVQKLLGDDDILPPKRAELFIQALRAALTEMQLATDQEVLQAVENKVRGKPQFKAAAKE